jgi:hypothetical protein
MLPVGPWTDAETCIRFDVPLMDAVTESVAVTVWLPGEFSVTCKIPVPLESAEFPGSPA